MNTSRIREVAAGSAGRARTWALAHKIWAGVIIIVVVYGGYRAYAAETATPTVTKYVTTTVATGTVVATLTESGQVSASQQIALSPKGSGEVLGVYVKPGQQVYAGQLIAQLDGTDAAQSLRNAQLSLQNAQLTYQQNTATSTLSLNLLEAQNGVTTSQVALDKARNDTYTSIASIYTDLSTITTGLDGVLHDFNAPGRSSQQNIDAYTDLVSSHDQSIAIYANAAETSYTAALAADNAARTAYQATQRTASDADLMALAKTTYAAAQATAEAAKDAHDFFDRANSDYTLYNLGNAGSIATLITSTNGYNATIASDLSAALTDETAILTAEQALAQAQNALTQTQGGSSALTVQQATLTLQQAKDAVTNAEETLANYSVYAPFAGTIASVGVQKYDQAGSGTTVATIVTNQETISLSVNEVDASKLKVGQKATITFDALPDVSIAGTLASVDTIGAVSQGVVSYNAVVTFDTQNASVKPGMSATADIITGSETGLVLPASAVKTSGGASYVQVFTPPLEGSNAPGGVASAVAPKDVPVVTGLIDDTQAIIENGITAGTQVVSQTISGTATAAKSAAAQSTSLFGGGAAAGGARAGGAGFGGATRTFTR